MKRKISLSAASLLIAASSLAHESGMYTGVGAFYSKFHSDVKVSAVLPPDAGTSTLDITKSFGNVSLFAGYQKYFGNSFIAGEVFVNPLRDTLKKTSVLRFRDDDSNNDIFNDIQLKIQRQFGVGARFKYGRHFDNKTAAFISLGVLGSQFKITHRDNSPQAINYKSFLFGYAPGVGIKYYLKQHLPITFQYDYEIYNQLSTKNMSLVPTSDLRYKFKNRYHSLMISISCEL